jgi:hypothetical protein
MIMKSVFEDLLFKGAAVIMKLSEALQFLSARESTQVVMNRLFR